MRRTFHAAVLTFVALGCAAKKSPLEQKTEEAPEQDTAPREHVQTSLAQLPAAPAPPPGVAPTLWTDLHWLPTRVVGVNGTPAGVTPILAQWVFDQPFAELDACRSVQESLVGGYGVEWAAPPQSFVFYANADLADVEACATHYMKRMGGLARMGADDLVLKNADDSEARVLFARRGEQLVAVVDDGRMGPLLDARSGRLGEHASLVQLLGSLGEPDSIWSASTQNMTEVPLGIPSLGYVMRTGDPGEKWEFRFTFADAAAAAQAEKATGPFLARAEEFAGVPFDAETRLNESVLSVSIDTTEFFMLEPAKLQELQAKLDEFAASGE